MKIRQGFWYLCGKSFGKFQKGFWHYSPKEGYLNANDNQPHRVAGFHYKNFTDCQAIHLVAPPLYHHDD